MGRKPCQAVPGANWQALGHRTIIKISVNSCASSKLTEKPTPTEHERKRSLEMRGRKGKSSYAN